MAISITQAVLAKFVASGNTDFSAASGMWFAEMPETLTLPFVGFVMGGEQTEYHTEDRYVDSGTMTFTVFAEGVAETERLAKVVMAIYDACVVNPNAAFTITGETCFLWQKTDYRIDTATFRNAAGSLVGEATFSYRYGVAKTLPS